MSLEGLIGFLDEEEEEEESKTPASIHFERNPFAPLSLSSSRQAKPTKLSPYFLVNWKDKHPTEEVFKFRLKVPTESTHNLFSIPTISLMHLVRKLQHAVLPDKFTVVVVVSSCGATKTSSTSNLPYQEWIVSDLNGTECKLLVFGEAFKQYSSAAFVHPVLALQTPGMLLGSNNAATGLTVHYSKQIMNCGESRDYARCKSCPMATNASVSRYCPTHAEEQMRVCAANRSNVSIVTKNRLAVPPPPPAAAAAAQPFTHASNNNGVTLRPSTKDAKRVVQELASKRTLSAGERMVMQALKLKETSSMVGPVTTPELNVRSRQQVANPPALQNKRTKLGSGLAGVNKPPSL